MSSGGIAGTWMEEGLTFIALTMFPYMGFGVYIGYLFPRYGKWLAMVLIPLLGMGTMGGCGGTSIITFVLMWALLGWGSAFGGAAIARNCNKWFYWPGVVIGPFIALAWMSFLLPECLVSG